MTQTLKALPPMAVPADLKHFTVTDMSRRLGEVLKFVRRLGTVVITRRGKPVAIMLSVRRYGEFVEAAAVRAQTRRKAGTPKTKK